MPRKPMPWFRFYVEAVADPKLRCLKPVHRWLWVAVLGAARMSPEPGRLLITSSRPHDAATLGDYAAIPERDAKLGLVELERLHMIERQDDSSAWFIPRWWERQFESDASRSAIPVATRDAVLVRDAGQCVDCGSSEGLEIDHVVPVSKGGGDELDNLQVLCGTCNRRKGNRLRQRDRRSNSHATVTRQDTPSHVTPSVTENREQRTDLPSSSQVGSPPTPTGGGGEELVSIVVQVAVRQLAEVRLKVQEDQEGFKPRSREAVLRKYRGEIFASDLGRLMVEVSRSNPSVTEPAELLRLTEVVQKRRTEVAGAETWARNMASTDDSDEIVTAALIEHFAGDRELFKAALNAARQVRNGLADSEPIQTGGNRK